MKCKCSSKWKWKLSMKTVLETDILYLNPPDQNPLQTFTQILCFLSVDNGFNNEKKHKFFVQTTFEFTQKNRKRNFRIKSTHRKRCFFVLSQAWDKIKLLSPKRNQTSDIQIPHSDALSLSHRGSMVSKAHHETRI